MEAPWLEKEHSPSLEGAEWSRFHLLKLLWEGQYESLKEAQENFGMYLVPEEIIFATENTSTFCSLESSQNPVLFPQQSHSHLPQLLATTTFAGLSLPRLVKHTHLL